MSAKPLCCHRQDLFTTLKAVVISLAAKHPLFIHFIPCLLSNFKLHQQLELLHYYATLPIPRKVPSTRSDRSCLVFSCNSGSLPKLSPAVTDISALCPTKHLQPLFRFVVSTNLTSTHSSPSSY